VQKRGEEHNSLPEKQGEPLNPKELHKFVANLCSKVFSKPLRWLVLGGALVLVVLSLWNIRVHYCASRFLARGERYVKEQNSEEAIENFRTTIKLNPRLLDAYLSLSKLHLEEGRLSLAVDELLKASRIFPDNPILLAALRQAYREELLHLPAILRVGIHSKLNPLTTTRVIEPLLSYLSQNLKCGVQLVLLPDFGSIGAFLKEERIDIAILGQGDLMRIDYGSEALPLLLVSSNKQNIQRSIIVTSRKGVIRSISDLKGKSFAFASRNSFTGYILPRMILLQEGIDPEGDFAGVSFMNSQEEVFLSLLEGKVDAGALAEYVFDYLSTIYPISGEIQVIARSVEISTDVLVVGKDVPPDLAAKIKTLLLSYPESASEDVSVFRRYTNLSIREETAEEGKIYTVILAEF